MSKLLARDSLQLFESLNPTQEEIVAVIEFYAADKLREFRVDTRTLRTKRVESDDDTMYIDFEVGRLLGFRVIVVEWDYTQGVAIPLVELWRTY